jgi:hypothetical protein
MYTAINYQVTAWGNSANAFFHSLHTIILAAVTLAVESGYRLRIKLLIISLYYYWREYLFYSGGT